MKNIILCGSMKVKEEIFRVQEYLEGKGFNVLIPDECLVDMPKEEASRRHFDKIVDTNNEYLLVVNATKNGIDNYIGPNSFCEVAFGFYFNKKVFLFNDIYEPYKDELEGWHVMPLKGNLDNIK